MNKVISNLGILGGIGALCIGAAGLIHLGHQSLTRSIENTVEHLEWKKKEKERDELHKEHEREQAQRDLERQVRNAVKDTFERQLKAIRWDERMAELRAVTDNRPIHPVTQNEPGDNWEDENDDKE